MNPDTRHTVDGPAKSESPIEHGGSTIPWFIGFQPSQIGDLSDFTTIHSSSHINIPWFIGFQPSQIGDKGFQFTLSLHLHVFFCRHRTFIRKNRWHPLGQAGIPLCLGPCPSWCPGEVIPGNQWENHKACTVSSIKRSDELQSISGKKKEPFYLLRLKKSISRIRLVFRLSIPNLHAMTLLIFRSYASLDVHSNWPYPSTSSTTYVSHDFSWFIIIVIISYTLILFDIFTVCNWYTFHQGFEVPHCHGRMPAIFRGEDLPRPGDVHLPGAPWTALERGEGLVTKSSCFKGCWWRGYSSPISMAYMISILQ